MMSNLNLLGSERSPNAARRPFVAERERFIPRNLDPLERMVRFDFVFHLGLDLFEIIGRDAVGKIHIVIKAVLHRRARSELRFRPDF